MVAQTPKLNPISTGPHLHKPTYMNKSDENVVVDFGNNYDTGSLSDFNVGMGAIIRDAKPLDDEESTAERDIYPRRMSVLPPGRASGKS
jgi:hypothetical protein